MTSEREAEDIFLELFSDFKGMLSKNCRIIVNLFFRSWIEHVSDCVEGKDPTRITAKALILFEVSRKSTIWVDIVLGLL